MLCSARNLRVAENPLENCAERDDRAMISGDHVSGHQHVEARRRIETDQCTLVQAGYRFQHLTIGRQPAFGNGAKTGISRFHPTQPDLVQ
jgi:hypothetical protein